MADRITYDKLVRDRIPEVIREDGRTAVCSRLTEAGTRLDALKLKLLEESHELLRARSAASFVREAADVFEVLQSLAREYGVPWQVVAEATLSRRGQRGGFENGVFLHAVVDGSSAEGTNRTHRKAVPSLITPESNDSILDVIRRELTNSVSCCIGTAF